MTSKSKKGGRKRPPVSIGTLRADLAIMDKYMFIDIYKCTDKQYYKCLEQFGAEDLAMFLYGLVRKLLSGEIECEPVGLRNIVIENYQLRIIKLSLYEYEKNGDNAVCDCLGYC